MRESLIIRVTHPDSLQDAIDTDGRSIYTNTHTRVHTHTHIHILFCVLEPCVFQSYNRNNRFLELFVIVLYLWNSFARSYHTFRAPDTLNLGLLPCPSCHPFPCSTRIPRRVELTPPRRASSASQKSQPLRVFPWINPHLTASKPHE